MIDKFDQLNSKRATLKYLENLEIGLEKEDFILECLSDKKKLTENYQLIIDEAKEKLLALLAEIDRLIEKTNRII